MDYWYVNLFVGINYTVYITFQGPHLLTTICPSLKSLTIDNLTRTRSQLEQIDRSLHRIYSMRIVEGQDPIITGPLDRHYGRMLNVFHPDGTWL